MDKAVFHFPVPSGDPPPLLTHPAGEMSPFPARGGPGPYPAPPPTQTRDTFQSNTSGANSGAFWPVQNPPPYLPPSHQTSPSDQRCPPWTTPAPGYGGQPYGYGPPLPQPPPGFDGYGPPSLPRFGFDPSVPPPALSNYPGPSQFPPMMMNEGQRPSHRGPAPPDPGSLGGPGRTWGGETQPNLGGPSDQITYDQQSAYPPSGQQHSQYGSQPNSHPSSSFRAEYPDRGFSEDRRPLLSTPSTAPWDEEFKGHGETVTAPPLDEETQQRSQDEQWLKRFLRNRGRAPQIPQPKQTGSTQSVADMRDSLYAAVRLVSKLSVACETLKDNLENESAWAEAYTDAVSVKTDLQERLRILTDPASVAALKKKYVCIRRRRSRHRQNKLDRIEERRLEDERIAEKEAAIDKWRMKRIHQVEEKKREQELKLAADSVLSEVRKKQADVKRMLDILRSLEKLRKLRKEAASRKGVFAEAAWDQTFDGQVESLRGLIRKRTAVYGAEENALRVMLEGEQEEERRRDQERRQRKEREKLLQKKREMEILLFGDEMPPDHPLQPFREYYTQGERSLPALIQIRREWDMCLVPENYPDGTSIPQSWVLPEAPSDEAWATALDRD